MVLLRRMFSKVLQVAYHNASGVSTPLPEKD